MISSSPRNKRALRRYANTILLLLLLFFDPGTQFLGNEKLHYAIQKSTKIKLDYYYYYYYYYFSPPAQSL